MNKEFQECLNKVTKEHHESSGTAETPEQYQTHTCKLLSDTVNCSALWRRCHSEDEVRNIQDTHIQARIGQFRDNDEGIDIKKCKVAEDYLNSGRADKVDESTEGGCSVAQVSNVQTDFQECSHNISSKLYLDVQTLEERRFSRDTNDLASELVREDDDSEIDSLDPLKDIKPRCCEALEAIAKDCIKSFEQCFSREDAQQIKRQHIQQMSEYYEKIYSGVGDLAECPQLKFLEYEIVYDDETEEDEEDFEDYEDDDEEDYNEDDLEEYNEVEKSPIPSSATSEANGDQDLMTSEDDEVIIPFQDPEGNAVIAQAPHIEASSNSDGLKAGLNMAFISVLCYSFCFLLQNC